VIKGIASAAGAWQRHTNTHNKDVRYLNKILPCLSAGVALLIYLIIKLLIFYFDVLCVIPLIKLEKIK
jgi:hypothetical protein